MDASGRTARASSCVFPDPPSSGQRILHLATPDPLKMARTDRMGHAAGDTGLAGCTVAQFLSVTRPKWTESNYLGCRFGRPAGDALSRPKCILGEAEEASVCNKIEVWLARGF
jgi:hypothetical protein